MNEHYLQNVIVIIDKLNSKTKVDYADIKRLMNNVNRPFLFEELIKNSDLHKYSSQDFKNWLPEIISFLQEANWTISKSKENIRSYEFYQRYFTYIRESLSNEETFVNDNLSEEQLLFLNNVAREKLKATTDDIFSNDIRIKRSKKNLADSTANYFENE